MADKSTFIKIDRNIVNWRWFQNSKILSVFIWLLIKANIKEGHFEKDIVHRGSLVTSNAHIAEGCGLTISNVRTALADLESTGEISRNIRNHYQLITINKYESYQDGISKTEYHDVPKTIPQLAGNSQATRNNIRIKEYKNGKKEKNKEKSPSTSPLSGGVDVPYASRMKPIDEGTIDDIPVEYRDMCPTYPDYWRFRNR